jgi:hypothetical protein
MSKLKRLQEAMFLQARGEFEGIVVDDTSKVPKGYAGEVLHVNDHGNVTLYRAFKNGSLHYVYAIV